MKKAGIILSVCFVSVLPVLAQEAMPEVATYKSNAIGEDSIISNRALKSFRGEYKDAIKHKAFAQSDSGSWGWRDNRTSKEHAMNSALIACQQNNKKAEAQYPCKIIHVNDEWIKK